ncbi:hypothetical protein EXU57_10190 [Segetibacter sp. 3557_3]|uniref:M14 family metallopeptidase n=1 Tax=Segetibacter sp. 3557_3 TaxID=2547429 RepID=UPI001058CADE|nr:M14 family metallopeptidase [Segetibacter sp. 3557_3]TDH26457.1 hypothetical protein EXU57_10190 [Segetibacter sp. 3557_3]
MKKKFYLSFLLFWCLLTNAQKHITTYEKSGGKETATYFETINFYEQLAASYRNIQIRTFDTTDAGYPLHLVMFSTEKDLDWSKTDKQDKIVILINNGIHPGEPDGIDASMMLLRDYVTGKLKLPANIALAFIPIYNIGGALNRNQFSRANQNGPASFGFRGNAQNLDLNRDFTKSDSKDARAFASIFHFLDPDILVDNHVSDGADYQYTMTLLTTQHNKLGGELGTFLHNDFEPALFKSMDLKKWPMTPYVNFEESSPEKGMTAFYDPPRYSSGYAALFQTIAFMPETHMLKPFKYRVTSTYALMQTIIEEASKSAQKLKMARRAAINSVTTGKTLPLGWKPDSTRFETIRFKGYEAQSKTSDVTGLPRLYYDHSKPFEKDVKFFNSFLPEKNITIPQAYILPRGWNEVAQNLKRNGVRMHELKRDTLIEVECYHIESYKSMPRPYEKHHRNSDVVVSTKKEKLRFLKGDYLIYCNQRANRYLVEMLEPTGDDSFFAWNFFDAILQQKEGYSDYRWEDLAASYLATKPALKKQLEEKRRADPTFAASSSAQLNFIYRNSPYYEPEHMRYPVFRLPLK